MISEEELLDWQKIYDWATRQEQGFLGLSCSNCDCPLARYLEQQTGMLWSVGPFIRPVGKRAMRLEKPDWVKLLIETVDLSTQCVQGPVTREAFLQALEAVKPQVERN